MNIIFAMGKMKLSLTTVLFWFILVLTCFMTENIPYVTSNSSNVGFTSNSFVMLTLLIAFLLIAYFVLEHKFNRMKIDWILFPIITIFFISSLIGIWSNPENVEIYSLFSDETISFTLTNQDKIYYSVEVAIMFVVLYALLFCYSKSLFRLSRLNVFLLAFILFNLIATVYSFVAEANQYELFFTPGQEKVSIIVKSLFTNKNIYAFCLFSGICSCIALSIRRARWWIYVIIVYLYLCMLFTICATTVIICSFLIPFFFVAEVIRGYIKRRNVLSTVMLITSIVVALSMLFFVIICIDQKFEPFYTLFKFIRNNFFYEDFSSFNNRDLNWQFSLDLISNNPMYLIFGRGLGVTTRLFSVGTKGFIRSAHSGYLEVLVSQGIIGFIIHSLSIIYFIYCIIRLFIKKKTKFALYSLVIMFCFGTQAFMESEYMFTTHVNSLVIMFIAYIPVVASYKHIKHPEICEEIKNSSIWNDAVKPIVITKSISMLHLILLGIMLLLIANPLYESNEKYKLLVNFGFIAVGISLLFIPHLISTWVSVGNPYAIHRRFKWNSFFIIFVIGSMSLLIYLATDNDLLGFLVGFCAAEFLVLLGETLVYTINLGSGFSNWAKNTFKGIFVLPHYSFIATLAIGALGYLIIQQFIEIDILITLIYMMWMVYIYLLIWYLSPFKMVKETIKSLNEERLFRFKREVINNSI